MYGNLYEIFEVLSGGYAVGMEWVSMHPGHKLQKASHTISISARSSTYARPDRGIMDNILRLLEEAALLMPNQGISIKSFSRLYPSSKANRCSSRYLLSLV